jgi:hypothetical protein
MDQEDRNHILYIVYFIEIEDTVESKGILARDIRESFLEDVATEEKIGNKIWEVTFLLLKVI